MAADPAYRLAVANTVTGKVVGDLPFLSTPTWSRVLNGAGSLSGINVPIDYTYLTSDMIQRLHEPWRWTILWAYGGTILQAGMLTSVTMDDTQKPVVASVSTTTLWDFFNKKRLVLNEGYNLADPLSDVVFSSTSTDMANRNLSLHSIARRLVEIAVIGTQFSYVQLPIILPDRITGSAIRNYKGADLAYVGARITELTQIDNGPEVEFVPEFSDSTQAYMRWRMRIGNNRLGQLGYPHAWDYQRALLSLPVSIDGTDMTFHVHAKGNDSRNTSSLGTVTGRIIQADVSNTTYAYQGWPMLTTADTNHTSVIETATINANALALVSRDTVPRFTASAVIRNNGLDVQNRQTGSPSLDALSVGDTALFGVRGHPILPDQQLAVRILTLESGPNAYQSKMVVQVIPQ